MSARLLIDVPIGRNSDGRFLTCSALISELSATQYIPDKAFPIFENRYQYGQIKVCWWLEGLDKQGMQFLEFIKNEFKNEGRRVGSMAPDWAIDLAARETFVIRALSNYESEFLTKAHLDSIIPRPNYSCEHFYKTGPSYPRLIP